MTEQLVEEEISEEVNYPDLLDTMEDHPIVHDDLSADKHLRFLAFHQGEHERIKELGEREVFQLKQRLARRLEIINNKIRFHEMVLSQYLERSGHTKWVGVSGEIKKIKPRNFITDPDPELFFAWCNIPERSHLVRVKKEVDKKAVMDLIKDSGEIPPGLDLGTGEEKIKVTSY